MFGLGRHWQYGKYLLRHKWFVFRAAWEKKYPWQIKLLCALHDNSKFLPDEWLPYASYFYMPDGTKRTSFAADGFTAYPPDQQGFRKAWAKHIQRNKHHPQHWIQIRSARCKCQEIPLHIQCQFGYVDRTDVLMNDDGGARCLTCDTKLTRDQLQYQVKEMPLRYRMEMLCDWIGAGLAQGTPDTLSWYKARGQNHEFGPETRAWIEAQLGIA